MGAEASFSGVIREGRFLADLGHWTLWQRQREGLRVTITADLERAVRTNRQNRTHFGLVVEPFQRLWSQGRIALNLPPYTKYETHSTLVQVLVGSEPGPLAGSVLAVPTRNKDTKVFSKFFDDCRALAWDEYKMRIPEPGEME